MSTREPGRGLHEAPRAQHDHYTQAPSSAVHHEKRAGGIFHKKLVATVASVAAAVVVVCGAATTASANPLEAAASLFSAPAAQSLDDHTVTTTSPSGTTINLFDYWVNSDDHLSINGNGGVNANHRFQFNNGGSGELLNRWTGSTNPRSGIVNSTLSGGYPQLSDTWGGESLGYLFDSSAQTGKTSHLGVTGLLQAQGGYYVYDSSQNYAAYNADKNAFDVYDTWGINKAGNSPQGQFFPFDAADKVFNEENGQLVQNGITAQNNGDPRYNDGNPVNHHFGLSMSSRFVQPAGGTTNSGDDMVFDFAGDDDVWVFIDDVLVGDLGGIHDMASLSINFHTGNIQINGSDNGTLRNKYQAAGALDSTKWNGNTFADGSNHTLKFFYLKRGATDSNMKLKFNLVTVPESDIFKFDQDGDRVEGAHFTLYKTDESYTTQGEKIGSGTTDGNGRLTLTNDVDNGVINFDDLYAADNTNLYYRLTEDGIPKGHRSSFVETGGSMQLEYLPATAGVDSTGGVVINHGGMDADSAVWQNGAFVGAKETITAPSVAYKANDDLSKSDEQVDLDSGTLFAVVLKRDMTKDLGQTQTNAWYAIAGDSVGGYTIADKPSMPGAIEMAKKDPHAFTMNTSGQYQVEIPFLPGDISKYYYLMDEASRNDAEYAVAIYHTTASSIGGATPENTVHVYSDDIADGTNFQRQFATRLLITNIENRLFVQKTDASGVPLAGATFGLYTPDQVDVAADGTASIKGDVTPFDKVTTQDSLTDPVTLEGAGVFPMTSDGHKPLSKGTYYLKEIGVPDGYLMNDTVTKVIIDDKGVHVDAGTDTDGVSTFVGPGSLMKSLGQFGAQDDINNTLTWIKGQRQTSDGTLDANGNLSWSDTATGGTDEVHLEYGASGRVYQYGPVTEGDPYRLETDTGWLRMGLTQDAMPDGAVSTGVRTDLTGKSLNALFTGATCVRIADDRATGIEVTKHVDVPEGLEGNPDAKFAFQFGLPEGNTYEARVFEHAGSADETPVGDEFELKNGDAHTLRDGQTIRVYCLAEGDSYTVRELTSAADGMPAGFTLTGREKGGQAVEGEGEAISGTVARVNSDGTINRDNQLVFTNSYNVAPPVTLGEINAQKVLAGRDWKDGDSFKIYLRADDGTPMPEGAEASPVAGKTQVVKTATNEDVFSFGSIEYTKPGTYIYSIAEVTPSENDPSWLGGFGYSSVEYRVTVKVADNHDGTMSEPDVTMQRVFNDDGTSIENDPVTIDDKIAVVTNTYDTEKKTISFNVRKTYDDQSGANQAVAGKFTFQVEALGGLNTADVPTGTVRFGDLAYSIDSGSVPLPKDSSGNTVTTATSSETGVAAFPHITFEGNDENRTYVYKVTEVPGSDASTTGGMTYDPAEYYVMVATDRVPTDDGTGTRLASTATYWNADGTPLESANSYIPFTNTYEVDSVTEAPVAVQKTLSGRAWEATDSFTFTLTPDNGATRAAVASGAITQKAADSDATAAPQTATEIAGEGNATRKATFGAGNLVFSKPGTYTFAVTEDRPADADTTGIAYDGHRSKVTYVVTDLDANGKHTGKLTASVSYDNRQATTTPDTRVTDAAAFTNTYAATGTYAGLDVVKTMTGAPLENGQFPFTIEPQTYDGVTAPAPADGDWSFTNTKGADDGNGAQKATMSGKLSSLRFTQMSYGKTYVYKVAETHGADGSGFAYDTTYTGDAYVLIAVKPNPDNKAQLYTETTVVKGPDVTALVDTGGVDALTPEAIAALSDEDNYKQTTSSLDAGVTPTVPFVNSYAVEPVDYSAKAGLQIKKTFEGTGSASSAFSFTVTPLDSTAFAQDGSEFVMTTAAQAAAKLGIDGDSKTYETEAPVNLGDTAFVNLLPASGLTFTHDDVANANGGNVYEYEVVENGTDGEPAGYAYDHTVYRVTIEVFDYGDSTIGVETSVHSVDPANPDEEELVDFKSIDADSTPENSTATIPFANTYNTTASDAFTPQVTKKIEGIDSTDKAFSFALTATPETQAKIAAGDLTVSDELAGGSETRATTGTIASDGQTLDFSGMTFAKAGDYTFTLAEAHDADDDATKDGVQNAGWTMDASTYDVTVTVADQGSKMTVTRVTVRDAAGNEVSPAVAGGKANLATFTNAYGVDLDYGVRAGMQITKVLTGRDMTAGQFAWTVVPTGDNAAEAAARLGIPESGLVVDSSAAKNGETATMPVSLAGASFSNDDAGKTYTYQVSETTGGDAAAGYTNDATVYTVTIAPTFDAATGVLSVTTTVDGGTYHEEKTVTSADTTTAADPVTVPFANSYKVQPGSLGGEGAAKIVATKQLTNRPMTDGEFTFAVTNARDTASPAAVVATGTNAADGTITFDEISYTTDGLEADAAKGLAQRTIGADGSYTYTYSYLVSEDAPAAGSGVTAITGAQAITVTVTDKGDGSALGVAVTYPEGGTGLTFVNQYGEGADASVDVAGMKTLALGSPGLALTQADIAGKYTFTLTGVDEDGQPAPLPDTTTANNDAAGNVTFGTITYTMAGVFGNASGTTAADEGAADGGSDGDGAAPQSAPRTKTYTYTVTETGDVPGVTNDAAAQTGKTFTVTVTDNGDGTISATPSTGTDLKFSFENTYDVPPVPSDPTGAGNLTVTKAFTTTPDRPLAAGEFTFELVETAADGTEKVVSTGTNDANGTVTFGEVTFTGADVGEHTYQMREVAGSAGGVTYDPAEHTVTATVTDQKDGTLAVTWKAGDELVFSNTYEATPATATLAASKQLAGATLTDGQFSFTVTSDDGAFESRTATNDASGQVNFGAFEFEKAGTYSFTIAETNDGQDRVTYDEATHKATVTVTDDGEGHLVAKTAYDGDAAPVFTNTYTPPTPPTPPGGSDEPGTPGGPGGGSSMAKTSDALPLFAVAALVIVAAVAVAGSVYALRRSRRTTGRHGANRRR